jgi:hypothetical protein
MRTTFLLLGLLCACKKEPATETDPGDTADTDVEDTDTGPTGYPSSFTSGKYRMNAFVLQPVDEGADLDGDGTPDNNLPKLLTLADTAISGQGLSPDAINATIADNIATGQLVILVDAAYADFVLGYDVLAGAVAEDGTLGIDPSSYDAAGNVRGGLTGTFTTEADFNAATAHGEIPVTFIAGDPPLLVPMDDIQVVGSLEAAGTSGFLYGVLPAQSIVDNVIEPLIPAEGYDSDGDGSPDFTKEQLMGTVTSLVNNENMADIVYPDGTRGVSAAFRFTAAAADF